MDVKENFISIVIISALRYEKTKNCLAHIHKNTTSLFEVIIVDISPELEELSWLYHLESKYPDVKLIHMKEDHGTGGSRNIGFNESKSDYIVFIDNDVIVTPGWDEALIETAKKSDDIGMVGSKILRTNEEIYYCSKYMYSKWDDNKIVELGLQKDKVYQRDDPAVNKEAEVDWYPTTTLLVKRNVFDEIGGFDENNFKIGNEDKDLCMSVRNAGYKIVYCPKSEVIHDHQYDQVKKDGLDKYHKNFRLRADILKEDRKKFEKKWHLKLVDKWP